MQLDPNRFFMFSGPCVAESLDVCREIAETLKKTAEELESTIVFKASYVKANRSSGKSFRGPGLDDGLKILQTIKQEFDMPVVTDIHETGEVDAVAEVVDVLQIPAFLCRQTALIEAAANTGRYLNIKKGQFLAPWDVQNIIDKVEGPSKGKVFITERGSTFGYNNLVVDYRGLIQMKRANTPLIMDATHSVQMPGGQGTTSGGDRTLAFPLARAAASVGVKGFFFECHPNPEKALSDGPNSVYLKNMPNIARTLKAMTEMEFDD